MLDHLTVKLCDHTLAQESETVFLGVILDEHLSLMEIAHCLPSFQSLQVFRCYLQVKLLPLQICLAYTLYCISVWGLNLSYYFETSCFAAKNEL